MCSVGLEQWLPCSLDDPGLSSCQLPHGTCGWDSACAGVRPTSASCGSAPSSQDPTPSLGESPGHQGTSRRSLPSGKYWVP